MREAPRRRGFERIARLGSLDKGTDIAISVVNATARTESSVSRYELFHGFQLISSLSNRDPLKLSDAAYLERSRGELGLFRRVAVSGISKSVYEVCGSTIISP